MVIASLIGLSAPSISVQMAFKNAGTFSNKKKRGLISCIILIDSTTKEFRFNSSPFLWLATDIPWQGGVAITTSISLVSLWSFHICISRNTLSCTSCKVMSPQMYPLSNRHLLLYFCTLSRLSTISTVAMQSNSSCLKP